MINRFFFAVLISLTTTQFSFGQTSGPSTPDVQKFTPASVNNMVNLFSGDLIYNIPLLQLDGGYPITISYTSGAGMNEEANCVGLGWQINIGRINRTVRGLPDDFKGDKVIRRLNQRPEWNIGIGVGVGVEIFGFPVGVTTGLSFSNMRGVDIENNLSAGIGTKIGNGKLSAGLTLGMSTNEAASITPNAGLSYGDFSVGGSGGFSLGVGGKISSMEGVKQLGFTTTFQKGANSHLLASFPLSMAKTPFTPRIEFPSTSVSGSFKLRFGAEIWGLSTGGEVYGQFAKQSYSNTKRELEGYGYIYLREKKDRDALMDMGSEKDGPVFQEDKNMSISYLANDVFSVSAQGISGTFRPFRKDIIISHDENQDASDFGGNLGVETHGAAYYHFGIDLSANIVNNYSGEWQSNPLQRELNAVSNKNIPVYFRNLGESNAFRNRNILTKLGGNDPVAFNIGESTLSNNLSINSKDIKESEYSNYSFQYLTAAEAVMAEKKMNSYEGHGNGMMVETISRMDNANGVRKGHHISFITVTKDDGTIYEFGIAAYNNIQKEVTFNIEGKTGNQLYTKLTGFADKDSTEQNDKGKAAYFSSTETPPYAYAYLLTAVYSPDYVDLTGDGPSSDDLGNYTKFNYTRETTDFVWQTPTPFTLNPITAIANYNHGNLCDQGDDMASFIYGEKEIWMIHSIETKNYFADFLTSVRQDGHELSLKGRDRLSKIDVIKLYVRTDYFKDPSSAVPIQSIFFTYDQSLCTEVPASGIQKKGKLTLKKIAFSYDRSNKEKHSFYSFDYFNEMNTALKYDETAVDWWGNFKRNDTANVKYNNIRFPFSEQNPARANEDAKAWNLKRIILPAGGQIEVEYEAKDYAYVQDKPAMQMYKIEGFSFDGDLPARDLLYDKKDGISNMWVIVALEQNTNGKTIDQFVKDGEKLYINCIVDPGENAQIHKEEISGFFEFDIGNSRFVGTDKIAIKLKPVDDTNPIARAFWQKMRKNLNHVLYPAAIDDNKGVMDNIVSVVKSIPRISFGFLEFLKNYKSIMMKDGRGEKLDGEYGSYIRLYNPIGKKFGGGSRVKRIVYHDNWDKMTDNKAPAAVYGKEYRYTTTKNGGKNMISSGVATYEPIGNEENPFVQPTGEFNNANALAPELYYYKTEPFGESFFPSPSIGYSRVMVSDIQDPLVKQHSTGFDIYEYYTSRDFPTITKRTPKIGVPGIINSLLVNQRKYTASQGFLIELNDMHGKLKSQKMFSKGDSLTPVSGVEYRYKTINGHLENTVSTIDPLTGIVTKENMVGMDYDFYISTSESRSLTKSPAIQVNLDVIPGPLFIPVPVVVMLPFYSENLLQYKGVTTTKLVYRTGLLDEIVSYDNGSETSVKNILYDEITGDVLISSSHDERHNLQYKTKLPAYWFYSDMGPGSLTANTLIDTFRRYDLNKGLLLNEADELVLWTNGGRKQKAWVYKNSKGEKTLINEQGETVGTAFENAKIIRTGHKNMQSISAADIISGSDPVNEKKLKFEKVIDASATEFKQYWQAYYSVHPPKVTTSCRCENDVSFISRFNNLNIRFNRDGTIKAPAGVSSDGLLISIQKNDTSRNCLYEIYLDKGLDGLNDRCVENATIRFNDIKPIRDSVFCEGSQKAEGIYRIVVQSQNVPGTSPCGEVIQEGKFILKSNCDSTLKCFLRNENAENDPACNIPAGNMVNPYLLGILGNWRQTATYKYLTTRTYDKLPQKDQGYFKDFDLFREPLAGFFEMKIPPSSNKKWQVTDSTAIYDPHGKPVEMLNALKIPNSKVYGYGYNFPLAEASNADYYEIAADGFEDYDFENRLRSIFSNCLPEHFKFDSLSTDVLANTLKNVSGILDSTSHTGRRCLFVAPEDTVRMNRKIRNNCNVPYSRPPDTLRVYKLTTCDIMKQFSPIPGKEYVINLWINEERSNDQLDSSSGSATITFFGPNGQPITSSLNFHAKGAIIDNWQQVNGLFKVPVGVESVQVELSAGKSKMFVDDMRIHPFNSMMKGYVFDPLKLRLMANLDEQNYATFYEYDGEGQLTRIKRETEGGIITAKEIRSAKPKVEILIPK